MNGMKVLERGSKSSSKTVKLVARISDAKCVSISGDFTGWSEEGIPLRKGADGEWKTELILAPGDYEYRLRVDGQWRDHSEAAKRVSNPFGSENCVLSVKR